jgi:tripartite-type tricarboxylate transporter receptor subunit TctC
MTFKRLFCSVLVGATATLSYAQEYPVKPVRIVVPFSPGGFVDNSARAISDKLGARLGQQVVVENRAGASGNLGTAQVAQAAPDGYTLLLGFDGTLVINPSVYAKMPFDSVKDFQPITKIGDGSLIIVAHPSVPANNLKEMIALSKEKPGSLSYGTSGTGSTPHVFMELMKMQLGIDWLHIPYKGGGQAIVDVVGGSIPLVGTAIATAQQYVKQGRLKAIGIASAKRDPALPDVPTFAESGAPDMITTSWSGVLAPAKTPRPIIDRLHREMVLVLKDPEVRQRLAVLGIEPVGNTPEEYGAQIRADIEKWRPVVKAAGIKLE